MISLIISRQNHLQELMRPLQQQRRTKGALLHRNSNREIQYPAYQSLEIYEIV